MRILAASMTLFVASLSMAPFQGQRDAILELLGRAKTVSTELGGDWLADYQKARALLKVAELAYRAKAPELANDALDQIRIDSQPPNRRLDLLVEIARVRAQAGSIEQACESLAQARQLLTVTRALVPDTIEKYEALVKAEVEAGESEWALRLAREALALAEGMPARPAGRVAGSSKAEALRKVACSFAAAGDDASRKAVMVMTLEAVRDRAAGDRDAMASVLSDLAKASAREGRFVDAMELLNSIKDPPDEWILNGKPYVVAAIARHQFNVNPEAALRTISIIESAARRWEVLRSMAEWRADSGDWPGAELIWRAALPSAEAEGEALVVIALSQLAIAQVHRGRLEAAKDSIADALRGLDQIQAMDPRLTALAMVAQAQAASGDRRGAESSLSQIQAALRDQPQESPFLSGYERCAVAQAMLGQIDEAIASMAKVGLSSVMSESAEPIALAAARIGSIDGAMKALNSLLPRDPRHVEEVGRIAAALAREGERQRAMDWAERQRDPTAKLSALLGAAGGLTMPPNPESSMD